MILWMTVEASHLLLDFFGTIVDYSPSWTEQGFHCSHALLREFGSTYSYEEFVDRWSAITAGLAERADENHREFSMYEMTAALLRDSLTRTPHEDEIAGFIRAYFAEWNTAVVYPNGMSELIASLAETHRLALVSNTNEAGVVLAHLRAMGITDFFDVVVLSVNVGWRKPHREIFMTGLETLGISAGDAVFVGDSHSADYLGPRGVGIRSFLIDPHHRYDVPDGDRLDSLFDLVG
jgi:putative hydrolase of the HAD superfamily